MKRHLSEEEIAAWMSGEHGMKQRKHLAGCLECRAEISRFQDTLAAFREAASSFASAKQPAIVVPAAPRWWQPRTPWLLACAALILFAAVPARQSYMTHQNAAREQALMLAAQDSALLKQVDAQISRAVPGPMEPLVTLVAWNTDTDGKSQRNNETYR